MSNKSNLEIDTPDIAHYVLEYEKTAAFITLNYYRRETKRQIECLWDNETWLVDLLTNKITNAKNELVYQEDFNPIETYIAQMRYFVTCIKEEKNPMNSFNEAIKVLKICTDE